MSERDEESIFSEAIGKSPEEQARFLAGACEGRPKLRKAVESLLDAYQYGSCLEPPDNANDESTFAADETGKQVGPYRLLEKIGEGGMGAVYMAEQRRPFKRRVALKIIKLGMDTKQVVARFEAERQALAMMDHPNIAKVLDAGATETGRPYFVMELVRGISITEYCDRNCLSIRNRLELFVQTCHAVQHAHQKGVIHRDVKPSNVLVTLHDGLPVPKVIDFGIAKATQAELTEETLFTQFHQMIGTPAYMSPEQAELSGLDIDTRADIYSLGVLLYELLTSKTPLDCKDLIRGGYDEMRRRIMQEEPLTPSSKTSALERQERTIVANLRSANPDHLESELKGDLDWIVMKSLAKDRVHRYETANGLATDVQRYLANDTVLARPLSARYRLQKLIRRNRFVFIAIGAVMFSLLLGVAVSIRYAIRASHAEQEQIHLRRQAQLETGRANLESQKARRVARDLRHHVYAADMMAADKAVRENNLGFARGLLERYFPASGQEDLRGVEWRYLWQRCRSDALKEFQHDVIVNQAVFSPNGSQVATATIDGTTRIWGVDSGQRLAQFEGRRGRDPHRPLAYSPDGRFLACADADGVTLRDTSDWEIVRHLPGGSGVALFSPRDGGLFACLSDNRVHLWDADTWEEEASLAPAFTGDAWFARLSFSADSRLLAASAGDPPEIHVWNVVSGQLVANIQLPRTALSMTFTPDDRWLAVGDSDGGLVFWNVETEEPDASYDIHASFLFGVIFLPDGETLATGGGDQLIRLWSWLPDSDPPRLKEVRTLKGHENEILSLEASQDDRYLITASQDGTAKLWSTTTRPPPTLTWDAGGHEWMLGFSADGKRIHTVPDMWGKEQLEIRTWDVADLGAVGKWPLPPDNARYPSILLAGDNVVCGTTRGEIQVWNLQNRRLEKSIRTGNGAVVPLGLSPDQRLVCAWDMDARVAGLWNLATDRREVLFSDYDDGALVGRYHSGYVAFSPSGRFLAYPASNYRLNIWDIAGQRERVSIQAHKWRMFRPQFSPDGRLLATSSWDGRAKLWNVVTSEPSVPTLRGHLSGATLNFTSDGKTVITSGTRDQTIQFWNVATGKQMVALQNAERGMLSPDDMTLVWRQSGAFRVLKLPSLVEIDAAQGAVGIQTDNATSEHKR